MMKLIYDDGDQHDDADVIARLREVERIAETVDHGGEPVNSPAVLGKMSVQHRDFVSRTTRMTRNLVTDASGENVDPREIRKLAKIGMRVDLGPDPDDPLRLIGTLRFASGARLDLSDPPTDRGE